MSMADLTSGTPTRSRHKDGNGAIEEYPADSIADHNAGQETDISTTTILDKVDDRGENCKCDESSELIIDKSHSFAGCGIKSESEVDVKVLPIHENSLNNSTTFVQEFDAVDLLESEGKEKKLDIIVDQFTNKLVRESILTAAHCEVVNPFYEEGTEHLDGHRETGPPSKLIERCRSLSECVESSKDELLGEERSSFEKSKRFSVPEVWSSNPIAPREIASVLNKKKIQEVNSVKDIPESEADEERLEMSIHQQLKGNCEEIQQNCELKTKGEILEESCDQHSKGDYKSVNYNQESESEVETEKINESSPQHLNKSNESVKESCRPKSVEQINLVEDESVSEDAENKSYSQNEESPENVTPNEDFKDLQRPCSIHISTDFEQIHSTTTPQDDSPDLMRMSSEDGSAMGLDSCAEATTQAEQEEEEVPKRQLWGEDKKVTWKVGYLHVKLPHKARGKGHLKAWKRKRVVLQPDEFGSGSSLVLGIYGSKDKHALFWQSVSGTSALVYRSSSSSRSYAFTVAEHGRPLLHLAADSETESQEWMAAARAMLWPPSPVLELQKMLTGSEFEVSLVENDFAVRAGLMGAYGLLQVTPRKLILSHPHHGHVMQEWYLSTVDRFRLLPQDHPEDKHRVVAMVTCSDSSTGSGELLFYCAEAVAMLQAVAATVHRALQSRQQSGGSYQKELQQIAGWLEPDATGQPGPQPQLTRQVHSLLDIPKLAMGATADTSAPDRKLPAVRPILSSDDLLCSLNSLDAGPVRLSDSELSDSYTPPRTPPAPRI